MTKFCKIRLAEDRQNNYLGKAYMLDSTGKLYEAGRSHITNFDYGLDSLNVDIVLCVYIIKNNISFLIEQAKSVLLHTLQTYFNIESDRNKSEIFLDKVTKEIEEAERLSGISGCVSYVLSFIDSNIDKLLTLPSITFDDAKDYNKDFIYTCRLSLARVRLAHLELFIELPFSNDDGSSKSWGKAVYETVSKFSRQANKITIDQVAVSHSDREVVTGPIDLDKNNYRKGSIDGISIDVFLTEGNPDI